MKLDMFWTRLLFIIISLVINVKTVVKLEENSGLSESSWFKNWKQSTTTPRELEKLPEGISTTPGTDSFLDEGKNVLLSDQLFVGSMNPEFKYESIPKPGQVSTLINVEPAQSLAIRPRISKGTISNNKKDEILDITSIQTTNIEKDVESETTSEKTVIQLLSNAEPIRQAVLSPTKLEQLSEPLSSHRYANYNPVKNVSASSSSPEFVPYSLSSLKQFEFKCSKRNGYYGIANNCDKFIECKEYVPKLYKCSHDLQFNSNAVWPSHPCSLPSKVNCKNNHILFPTDQPSSKPMLISSPLYDYSCAKSKEYYRFGHSCDQFIECKKYVASLYKCPPGLQFYRSADHGEDPCAPTSVVRCEEHFQLNQEPALSSVTLISSHLADSLVKQPSSDPKFSAVLIASRVMDYICPLSNGYYKLDNACEKFIKCEHYIASLYKCPSGLHFRSKAGANENPCAVPSIAQCEKEVKFKPKSSALLVDPNLEDYRCSAASGYFGLDSSCERFIECQLFVPSLYMCPNGLLFNRRAVWGEDPCSSSVRCEIMGIARATLIEEPGPKKLYTIMMKQVPGYLCSLRNGYFSVKDKCDHFIMCKQNVATLNICNMGLHFNRNAAWEADPCSEPLEAHCERINSLKRPSMSDEMETTVRHCPRSGYLYLPLDNTECSKYIRCEYGRAIIMPCPSGLVFNAELEACDWPVNVPSCNSAVFHGFTCPAPEVNEDGIPSDDIMKFRYGQSCKKFIACQAGRPRLLSCDLGLSFSQESQDCIVPDSVPDCKD